ncbi:class C beta-lactamase-related serine hydrolase [Cohnella endophytica]|uniref:Class C beta-lactamase-related serine hydrolase n=1 Tax=Cohnella endophytica TaxID=2419778 RepID=A0A494Y5U4_9BACL|nr:serine hydrolase [Cohnella endophytica]RKP56885.1 class C beta-lactamase-related serine hydrolase [Cohnella endophytica]
MNDDITFQCPRTEQLALRIAGERIDYCEIRERGKTLLVHSRDDRSADNLHKVNSITKSILSLLIGIAIGRGEFPRLDIPIADVLAEAKENSDLASLTAEHLLTMTPGWDWQEMGDWRGLPYPMTESPDWVRFVLARPLVRPSGTRMTYDSGSSQVLSAMLQRSTGLTAAAYAERHLFGPLGIEAYAWPSDPQGISVGGFGLELYPSDLTKLGMLVLQRGEWNGAQIVSRDWIADSMKPRFRGYDNIGAYGYHWWALTEDGGERAPMKPRVVFAVGFGGQYIFVSPERELVAVFASSLGKKKFLPLKLFRQWLADDSLQSQ